MKKKNVAFEPIEAFVEAGNVVAQSAYFVEAVGKGFVADVCGLGFAGKSADLSGYAFADLFDTVSDVGGTAADAVLRAENPCQFVRCAGTQAAEQGQHRDTEDEVAFEPDVARPGFAALEDFLYRAVAEGNFGVRKAVSRREQTVFRNASRQFQPGNVQGQCFACEGGKFRAAVRALQNQAVDNGEEGGHIF